MIETVLCAAYKRLQPKTGNNFKNPECWANYGKIDDIYGIEIGRRHNDILSRFRGEIDTHSDGFYTSYGRYVDRQEAYRIAETAGQLITSHVSGTLYSEDMY